MPSPERACRDTSAPSTPEGAEVLTETFVRNQQALYLFVRNLVGDAEEARDVVQETFMDAWRAALRGKPPFTGSGSETDRRRWLFHVVYQRAISLRRHQSVLAWESLDQTDEPGLATAVPSTFEERVATGDALRMALYQLEPSDAACIILKTVHGFSSVEMAPILDLSPEAVRKRFSRAMGRLRAVYFAGESQQPETETQPEGRM